MPIKDRVINIDDPFGLCLAEQCRALTVSSRVAADVCAEDVRMTGSGIQARLRIHGKSLPFSMTHREVMERAVAMGLGDLDNSAILEVRRESQRS